MTYTLPLRLIILHLAQRFRTDGDTFITNSPYKRLTLIGNSQVFYYIRSSDIRPDFTTQPIGSLDSQDQRFPFGDSDSMFKMRRQGSIR